MHTWCGIACGWLQGGKGESKEGFVCAPSMVQGCNSVLEQTLLTQKAQLSDLFFKGSPAVI